MKETSLPLIAPDWDSPLTTERKLLLRPTIHTLLTNSETGLFYPAVENVFNAFRYCPYDSVRVVILGQDPYHGPLQAHGLSFSVPDRTPLPPSLRNIYKEIEADIGTSQPPSGNLERWAKQGVLLLNSTLTVSPNQPGSHQHRGWEEFTDAVIAHLSQHKQTMVFMLWGNAAQGKLPLIDQSKHLVLTAPHPSPLSAYRGFFGCRHFGLCNQYLTLHQQAPIAW
jgi:uracil-DNA glycosylase